MNTYEQKAHWTLELFPQRTLQINHKKIVIRTTNFPDYLPRLPHTSNIPLSGTLSSVVSLPAVRTLLSAISALSLGGLHFSTSACLPALTHPHSVLRKLLPSFCNRPALYVTHVILTIHLVDNHLSPARESTE